MTEAAISQLGFKRVHINTDNFTEHESYYYYVYKIGNLEFTSNSSNDLSDGSWYTELFESGIRFHKSTELKTVIDLLEYNKIF